MHGLVTLFLEVIVLAIILLVIGLVAPHVLVVVSRAIVAPIVSMTIVGSSIIAVASVMPTEITALDTEGQVLKIWHLKPTKVHKVISI